MNGPWHYHEAEFLLERADSAQREWEDRSVQREIGPHETRLNESRREQAISFREQAQVHATLALAAATIDVNSGLGLISGGPILPTATRDQWADAFKTPAELAASKEN